MWTIPCHFFILFYSGHCIVCPSNYSFWLPLWYLPTYLWTLQ